MENRIENRIREAGGENLTVGNIDVSLLQRQVKMQEVEFRKSGKSLTIPEVELEGIDFLEAVRNNNLVVNTLSVKSPDIIYYPSRDTLQNSSDFSRNIEIGNFKVVDGMFRIQEKDSVKMFLKFPEFRLSEVTIDSTTLKKKIPFHYEGYNFSADSLMINLGPLHSVSTGELTLSQEEFLAKDVKIIPFEDKLNFQKRLKYEKDRVVLHLEEVKIDSLDFGFVDDSLHLAGPKMLLSGGDLEIFRNRLLPDNPEEKMMYSELLRTSPVKLDFDEVQVNESQIVYEEKIAAAKPAAEIGFYDVNGTIKNLTNVRLNRENFPQTEISASANFLKVAPLNVDYSFNVGTRPTRFTISGDFGTVPAEAINRYLRLARDKKAEGKLQSLAFTFSGDENVAVGDVRVEYDNFKIILLEDSGEEKEGFFTAIANLFVDNDGTTGPAVVENLKITRDKTKSFWSYIWGGIQKGLVEAMSQL